MEVVALQRRAYERGERASDDDLAGSQFARRHAGDAIDADRKAVGLIDPDKTVAKREKGEHPEQDTEADECPTIHKAHPMSQLHVLTSNATGALIHNRQFIGHILRPL